LAVSSGYTSQGVLATAGHAPDVWAAEIVQDLPNTSVMLGGGTGGALINAIAVPKGAVLSVPYMGARTLSTRSRTGTTDEGTAITFEALSDSDDTLTKRFSYNAVAFGYEALNDMTPERAAMSVAAHREQMLWALGNDIDVQTLGLYSSAANFVGSGVGDFASADLAEAIRLLKVANAPLPYACVLPSTQWDHIAQDSNIVESQKRGDAVISTSAGLQDGFNYHGVRIFTTGNVPTASNVAHGLVFSAAGIRFVMRDQVTVKEWDDPDTFSQKLAIYQDFAYMDTFTDWIVDFQTIDT